MVTILTCAGQGGSEPPAGGSVHIPMPPIHRLHVLSFLLGVVAASIVAVVLTCGPDAPLRPRPATNSPVASSPESRSTEPAPPPEPQIHIVLPSAPPATPAATDEQIAVVAAAVGRAAE